MLQISFNISIAWTNVFTFPSIFPLKWLFWYKTNFFNFGLYCIQSIVMAQGLFVMISDLIKWPSFMEWITSFEQTQMSGSKSTKLLFACYLSKKLSAETSTSWFYRNELLQSTIIFPFELLFMMYATHPILIRYSKD